jgi:hypothetical protein
MQAQEPWRRLLLRTEATAKRYEEAQKNSTADAGCRLCADKETITEYTHWRLVPNRFPYDRFFSKCEMLISKRHTDETGLTTAEKSELFELKNTVLSDQYDLVFENLPQQKSIPHHIHYHLVKIKREA